MRVDTRFQFFKRPADLSTQLTSPGLSCKSNVFWGLAKQPECSVSRNIEYLPKIVLASGAWGIHESQRTDCGCCGLDREGLWCLWSTSSSVPRVKRLQPRVSLKGALSTATSNE